MRRRSACLTAGNAVPAVSGLSNRLADAVSLSRLLFFPLWAVLAYGGSRWAAPVMVLIMLTDLVDGPIARRLGTAGPRGQRLDGLCDVLVVAGGVGVLGLWDWRFLPLVLLMAACFSSWTLRCLRAGGGAYSRLGRYDGAACYLLILLGSAAPWFPAPAARVYGFLLWGALGATALLLGASGVENIAALLRAHRAVRGGIRRLPRTRPHQAGLEQSLRPSSSRCISFYSRTGHNMSRYLDHSRSNL